MSKAIDVFDEYTLVDSPPAVDIDNQCAPGAFGAGQGLQVDKDIEPRPLFNGRAPAYVLQSERPEHRIIVMLKAAGRTNVEIAEATGTSTVHVATIVKQPWAVAQILQEVESAGREPVIELMKGACMDAAKNLIDIANEAEHVETRRKANLNVLEFCFGKPDQAITTTVKKDPATLSDAELMQLAAKGKHN